MKVGEKAKKYAKKIIVPENRDSFGNEANLRTAEYWVYKAYLAGYNEAMRCQSNLKIKQLEWVEYESLRGRKSYFAETPFTPYEVSDGGGYYVMFSPGKRLKFKSADEAKAAAQADFERRVRECLD